MLRLLVAISLLLPSIVFGQLTDAQLSTQLSTLIPNNSTNAITPANVRKVTQDGYDAKISIYGNLGIKGLLGYNTLFTLTNDKQLVHKKYVDDKFAAIINSVQTFNGRTGTVLPQTGDYTFAQIGSKPTTIPGYGIIPSFADYAAFYYPLTGNPSGFELSSNKNTTSTMGNSSVVFPSELTVRAYIATLGIPGAQVQTDWNSVSGLSSIANKPTLATVATTGSYNDLLNKPTIPAAQLPGDWAASSGVTRILNKPTLSTVATTGSYNDLLNKPTIPSAQVQTDWNAGSGISSILNKPNLGVYELSANKANDMTVINTTKYPSMSLFSTQLGTKQNTISIPSGSLIGKYSPGTGTYETITLGADFSMVGGILTYSGSSSDSFTLVASLPLYFTEGTPTPLEDDLGNILVDNEGDTLFTENESTGRHLGIKTVTTTSDGVMLAADKAKLDTLHNFSGTLPYSHLTGAPTIPAAQINSDWNAGSGLAQILNKPTIPAAQLPSDWSAGSGVTRILNKPTLATVSSTGSYTDLINKPVIPSAQVQVDWNATSGITSILNKPTIPAAQVQVNWNSTSGISSILNKPALALVATSGSYLDLTNKPTIPAVQVNSDWNAASGVSAILNKPSIPAAQSPSDWTAVSGVTRILNKPTLAPVATSGSYSDLTSKPTIPAAQVNSDWGASSGITQILNKPTIPAAQVSSDWNALSGVTSILNKPSLSTVATTGNYSDLTGKPTVPAAQVNADWLAGSGITAILNKPNLGVYELLSNKATTLVGYNNTTYPTTELLYTSLQAVTAGFPTITARSPLAYSSGMVSLKGMNGLSGHASKWLRIKSDTSGIEPFNPHISQIEVGSISTGELFFSNSASSRRLESNPNLKYISSSSTLVNAGMLYAGPIISGTPNANVVIGGGTSSMRGLVIQKDIAPPTSTIPGNILYKADDHFYGFSSAYGEVRFDNEPVTKAIVKTALGYTPADSATVSTLLAPPFSDANNLVKNSSDPTKLLKLSAASLTGSKTATFQNANHIVAGTNITNNFTANQTYASGVLLQSATTSGNSINLNGAGNRVYIKSSNYVLTEVDNSYSYQSPSGFGSVVSDGTNTAEFSIQLGAIGLATEAFQFGLASPGFTFAATSGGLITSSTNLLPPLSGTGYNLRAPNKSGTIATLDDITGGGGGGLTGIGSFSSTGNSNAASVSGTNIIIHPATSTTPGAINTTTQTFAGNKTFNGTVNLAGGTPQLAYILPNSQVEHWAGELTTTNTGNNDVTVAASASNSASLIKVRVVARRSDTGGTSVKEGTMVVKNFGTVSLAPTYSTVFEDSDMTGITVTNNGSALRLAGLSGVTIHWTYTSEIIMAK